MWTHEKAHSDEEWHYIRSPDGSSVGRADEYGMAVFDPEDAAKMCANLNRIAELEAALRTCIEIAASDCEHEACKGVIETASRLVQLDP